MLGPCGTADAAASSCRPTHQGESASPAGTTHPTRAVPMSLRTAALVAALCAAAVAAVPATAAHAQSAAEHVALGDRDRAANPTSALRHYEAAVEADASSYEALWKASAAAVEAGELVTNDAARRATLYKTAEQH